MQTFIHHYGSDIMGLVLLEWKYFPTPKILGPNKFTYGLFIN